MAIELLPEADYYATRTKGEYDSLVITIPNSLSDELELEGGEEKFENAVSFEVTQPGEYAVEVLIRDEISGQVSEPVVGRFQAEPR